MAEETIVNGVASDLDVQSDENDIISKRDRDFDLGKDAKISELSGKIDALEQEKSALTREKKESSEKIRLLNDEIEGFKTNQIELNERLEKMQREIDQSEEDKKSLQAVAARAVELETDVSRLQHDLISTISESEEMAAELRKLKSEFEYLKQSNRERNSKIEDLEKEKISLLERINKDVEEVKKLKAENEIHFRDLESRQVKILERESEILGLQTVKKEKETQKSSLEEALKQSGDKFKEMEAEVERLKNELDRSEKKITELNYKSSENDTKCSKLLLPAAIASTGTVAAAAAVACYVNYARRR